MVTNTEFGFIRPKLLEEELRKGRSGVPETLSPTPLSRERSNPILYLLARIESGAALDNIVALDLNVVGTRSIYRGKTALDLALEPWNNHVEAAAYLRDELGALTGKAVRRRRVCRLAIRVLLQYKLHRRAKQWLIERPGCTQRRRGWGSLASISASSAQTASAASGDSRS